MRVEDVLLYDPAASAAAPAITVVEKRLTTRERSEPEAAARLKAEGVLLRALGGRVTPRLLATGEDEQGPWIRMHKLEFPTLAQRLERAGGGPLDPAYCTHAAAASFAALAELHEASDAQGPLGIVHADISPGNVALDDEGTRAVLLDLELACWRGASTRDGAFRGTVGYCAPEIARGELPTFASDLFALAATLLHASMGAPPRDGRSLAAVLAVAAERPLLDDPHVRAALAARGPTLDAFALCLAHDPAQRPSSARAVGERLRLPGGA